MRALPFCGYRRDTGKILTPLSPGVPGEGSGLRSALRPDDNEFPVKAPSLILAQIMTRHIVTVSQDDSLKTLRELFETHHFHHLLVTEGSRLVGVVSDRDLLKNISPFVGHSFSERSQDLATLNRRAHQIMTRQLITAHPDQTVQEAVHLMLQHGVSCLPIVDEQMKPVGIVSWRDLLRVLAEA